MEGGRITAGCNERKLQHCTKEAKVRAILALEGMQFERKKTTTPKAKWIEERGKGEDLAMRRGK